MCVLVPGVLLAVVLVRDRGDGTSPPAAGTGATASGMAPDPERTAVGAPAPDFELPDLTGAPVRLSGFRGRPVVLTFFASWCYPCREEFTALQALHERRDDLEVLAVNYRDIARDSRDFAERLGATFPVLLEEPNSDAVAARYGVRGIPVTFFIDADGTIAHPPLYGEGSAAALQPGVDAITG